MDIIATVTGTVLAVIVLLTVIPMPILVGLFTVVPFAAAIISMLVAAARM